MKEDKNCSFVVSWIHRIKPEVKAAFFSALLFGMFCHGMALFNKLSLHDDLTYLFKAGATVTSGRWMLHVLAWLEGLLYGNTNTSLPLFNGLLSILCIGITGSLLVDLLNIRKKTWCILLGCLLISFPFVAALFAYMFTSHFYMAGLLMMVVSAWLICRETPWWLKILAIGLGSASVGIYQAFLSFLVSSFILYDISYLSEENKKLSDFLKLLATQIVCTIGVLAVYFIINRFFLMKFNVALTAYQGIDQVGSLPVSTYLRRIVNAYREFIFPSRGGFQDMYPGTLHSIYLLLIAGEGLLAVRQIAAVAKAQKGKAVLLAVLFALMPLACNLIYVMSDTVHGVMIYGQVMHFVLLFWLLDRVVILRSKLRQGISLLAALVLAVTGVMFARYDNQCYLKAVLTQQEAISYYTTLVTQIKSQAGYQPDMELAFIENRGRPDPTFHHMDELEFIGLVSYDTFPTDRFLYDAYEDIMEKWCGFSPSWYWGEPLDDLPEVQDMPSYPEDGSIQIIHDVLVVKMQ